MNATDPNLAMLEMATEGLGPLVDQVVFLGGCAAGLLISDSAAASVRETNDVDVIVEIASRHDYHLLSDTLRQLGFREDSGEGAPLCRWLYRNVVLDIMPTDSAILGFSNRWYVEAMQCAQSVRLPGGSAIRLVAAPYFLATKLEAFHGRGNGDYMASHDMEDLVAVVDGRPSIADEVLSSSEALKRYLSTEFSALLGNPHFRDAIAGHLPADAANQARLPLLLKRMERIANEQ